MIRYKWESVITEFVINEFNCIRDVNQLDFSVTPLPIVYLLNMISV
jgi:hypothetical protein